MKINWGVPGDTKIAREHVIPGMQNGKYSKIATIASRSIRKAEKTAGSLGIEKAFGSYEELLDDTEVPVPLEDTFNNIAVLTALFRSAETGKWEKVTE